MSTMEVFINKPMIGKVWKAGEQIDLTHLGKYARQVAPIELHLKEDGDINNEPSFCIVSFGGTNVYTFAQISLQMLNNAMAMVGYQIIKKPADGTNRENNADTSAHAAS